MKKTFIAFLAAIMAFMIVFTAACATPEEGHNHKMSHILAVDATCEDDGNIEYWHCDGCDRNYYDANGDREVLSADDLVIHALGHVWENEWTFDADNHWHECSRCGDKTDVAAHSFENGVCVTCGYGTPIVDIKVTGVSLNQSTASVKVGGTLNLTATVEPSDATNKAVSWSSNNETVATVSGGVVTAKAAGTAVITVTTADGNKTATCTVTVSDNVVSVTGVSLNKNTLSMVVGGSETLTATVEPANATTNTVSWSSSDPSVASVESNGKVTAKGAGTTVITVTTTDGAFKDTCTVTVTAPVVNVTGVTLDRETAELAIDGTLTLVATVAPSSATNKSVSWQSDNTAVATVDNNGTVTAHAAGQATITVTTADGNKSATCVVTVSSDVVSVANVSLNKNTLSLTEGQNETLTATVTPSDATNKDVTWKSDNTAVATVDNNGKVTAVKAGQATITVTTADGNKTATCVVTVTAATVSVSGVSLNRATITVETGDVFTLTATVAPANATNKAVSWKSDNTAVATVDSNGKVTTLKAGEATITVTTADGNKTATCVVTVEDASTETPDGETITHNFNYVEFASKAPGCTSSTNKTTEAITVDIFTVDAGVYHDGSSMVNSQGKSITVVLSGDENGISFTAVSGSSTKEVTVSITAADGTVVYPVTVLSKTATSVSVDKLPAGTYTIVTVNSAKITNLKATEYYAPHICTLALVEDAQAATCTEAGNIAYWQCSDPDCGKYYSDAEGKNEITLEQTIVPATGHSASTAWSYDETGHWHVCLNGCGEKLEFAAHDTNGAGGACSVCGYIEGHTHSAREVAIKGACTGSDLTKYYICDSCGTMFKDSACTQVLTEADIEALSAHTLEHHAAVAATCTAQGNVEYWYCTACDKYYLNADATTETNEIDIVTNALGHNLGAWEYDSVTHYKTCTRCGEVDESTRAEHSFNAEDTCTVCGYHIDTSVLDNIDAYGAYNESMYAVLKTSDASGITAQYSVANANTWYDVASQQIRVVDGQVRVDVIGISPDKYDLKILIANKDVVLEDINVEAYDRSGYAHFNYTNGIGAYDDDGTLKDGALVIYVTDENKNNISNDAYVYSDATKSLSSVSIDKYFEAGTDKSIGYFLNNRQYTDKETYGIKAACDDYGAVAIRIVGKVNAEVASDGAQSEISGLTAYDSTENGGSVGDNGRMARMTDVYNLTIEGIGEDSQIFGWGFHVIAATGDMTDYGVHEGESFEVRNITFANYPEDAIGMEGIQEGSVITVPVQRCWVHNNTFMPGFCGKPAESDKAEGDGSCDFKRGYYYTFAYNYLEGCHKTNLIGSSDSSLQYNITMHHNMWKNCGSRIPLARQANIHFYNNYIYGEPGATLSYVISPRANSYLFVENNYFDGCKNIVSGSGGTIKFYGNTFYACYDDIPSQVTDRNAAVSNNCAYNGTDYSKFDTSSTLFYLNDYYVTDSVTARREVIETAGSNGHYNASVDMNEINPTQSVSVGDGGLTVDLSQVTKTTSVQYVNGLAFTNISGTSGGTVKGKGQLVTFTLTSEAQITLSGSGSGAAAGELIGSDGTLYAGKINGSVTVVLPAGTYIIASGIKDKEFTISSIKFEDTGASSEARVQAAIDAINAIELPVDLSAEEAVVAARKAYDALTASEKASFSSSLVTKLTNAEEQIGNAKVSNVIALINNIGEVTENSFAVINEARTAYNALSTAQQEDVTNYNVLVDAETAFEQYEVTNVQKLIDALTATTAIDVTDQSAVQQAYDKYVEAYDAYRLLDQEQMTEVGGDRYDKVTNGLAYLEGVLAVYDFKADLADFDLNNAKLNDLANIVNAYNALDSQVADDLLTDTEKTTYQSILTKYENEASKTVEVFFNTSTGSSNGFTWSGSVTTQSGSYNGTTFDKALKMESGNKTSITFVTSSRMTLNLYFSSRSKGRMVNVDGLEYKVNDDGMVTVVVESGSHTISKGDTNVELGVATLSPA